MQESVTNVYTNNEQSKIKMKEEIQFIIAWKIV